MTERRVCCQRLVGNVCVCVCSHALLGLWGLLKLWRARGFHVRAGLLQVPLRKESSRMLWCSGGAPVSLWKSCISQGDEGARVPADAHRHTPLPRRPHFPI